MPQINISQTGFILPLIFKPIKFPYQKSGVYTFLLCNSEILAPPSGTDTESQRIEFAIYKLMTFPLHQLKPNSKTQ